MSKLSLVSRWRRGPARAVAVYGLDDVQVRRRRRGPASGTLPTFDIEGLTFEVVILREGATFDIEGATFDIEGRKMTFDIEYDITTRYRRF